MPVARFDPERGEKGNEQEYTVQTGEEDDGDFDRRDDVEKFEFGARSVHDLVRSFDRCDSPVRLSSLRRVSSLLMLLLLLLFSPIDWRREDEEMYMRFWRNNRHLSHRFLSFLASGENNARTEEKGEEYAHIDDIRRASHWHQRICFSEQIFLLKISLH